MTEATGTERLLGGHDPPLIHIKGSPLARSRRRAGRSAGIVLASLAGHLLVSLILLRPDLPEPPRLLDDIGSIDASLIDGVSAAPEAPKTAVAPRPNSPEQDQAVQTPPPPDILSLVTGLLSSVTPTAEPQSAPQPDPAAHVAIAAATTATAASGQTCKLGEWLQGALQQDEQIGLALARIPRPSRSVANALMLWDGSWVEAPGAGAGLLVIRGAILSGVQSAPQPCRTELMTGPVLITLNDPSGATLLAIGSGQWRWDDLLSDGGGSAP